MANFWPAFFVSPVARAVKTSAATAENKYYDSFYKYYDRNFYRSTCFSRDYTSENGHSHRRGTPARRLRVGQHPRAVPLKEAVPALRGRIISPRSARMWAGLRIFVSRASAWSPEVAFLPATGERPSPPYTLYNMAKEKTVYVCSECGADSPNWLGR